MPNRFSFSFLLAAILLAFPLSVLARTPNDDYYFEQWYLEQIHAPAAWDVTTGNRDVVVAVIDSGVDLDHPDLQRQIWTNAGEIADDLIDNDNNGFVDDVHGWDFVNDDADPNPSYENGIFDDAINHGTIVAGVIGAETNNDEGVSGVNWRVRLQALRILDGVGSGDTEDAARAVYYAINNGADVINMSFSGFIFDEALERAVREAYRQGVLVVAAVGNDTDGGVNLDQVAIYPACLRGPLEDWVIGVGASDYDDGRADFSNYGSDCTDVSAPGMGVFGTLNYRPNNSTFNEPYGGYFDGTSVAAPQVAAVAALLKGAYPTLDPEQLGVILKLSVDPMQVRGTSFAGEVGAGRLNAEAALVIAAQFAGVPIATESAERVGTGRVVVARSAGLTDILTLTPEGTGTTTWRAYGDFQGGVEVAVGDVNGDGVDDVVTGAGVGGGPQVRIFSMNGELLGQFFAFDESLRAGVRVALGDMNGDGRDEIVASGYGQIRLFDQTGSELPGFSAEQFSGWLEGMADVRIATGDVDGNGIDEIILSSGAGVAPRILVIDSLGTIVATVLPYVESMTAGLFVDAGDVNGDGADEVVVGTRAGAGPQVQIWQMANDAWQIAGQFFAFDEALRGGVRVAVGDRDLDGDAEIIAAPGPGEGNVVFVFDRFGVVQASLPTFELGFERGEHVAIW